MTLHHQLSERTEDDRPDSPSTSTRRRRKNNRAAFGSIRKLPSGRFQARFTDSRNNRYSAPHTFTTKRGAEDWLATTRADMLRGTWREPAAGAVTLADYCADYLATRLDLAPATRNLYQHNLDAWLCAPLTFPPAPGRRARTVNLGTAELGAVTVAAVRDWYAAALHTAQLRAAERADRAARRVRRDAVHCARSWARENGIAVKSTGKLPRAVLDAWAAAGSPSARALAATVSDQVTATAAAPVNGAAGRVSVAQAYRLLRMILQQAVRDSRIETNPCQLTLTAVRRPIERMPATPDQIEALAAAMPARYAAAVQVAAWSGLRAGELFGLARRHVDLVGGIVRVDRAVTYLHDRPPFIGNTKTESSRRTVHLPPHVVALLRDHMDRYTAAGPDALVFTNPHGGIVTKDLRKGTFRRARARIGRPDLRWHDLRHTGATMAAQAGASLAELQHRMGHSTVRAAMVYQHHSADRDRELAQRMSLLATNAPSTSGTVVVIRAEATA